MSKKSIILLGVIVTLLIAIPITLYFLQQQQETRSQAAPATTLTLTSSAPSIDVGETFTVDVTINPNTNLVNTIQLDISYDATKLETKSEDVRKTSTFTMPELEPATVSNGTISVVYQASPGNLEQIIQTQQKIVTITFKALAPATSTQIALTPQTSVLSYADADPSTPEIDYEGGGTGEVLQGRTPVSVAILAATGSTPTPTPNGTTITPTPTGTSTSNTTPTPTQTQTATPTPTTTQTGGASNQSPICTALNLDRTPSGTAPFSITFTALGNDPDDTVSKATFNYGDGPTEDILSSGGLGTNSVNVQKAHTYNNPGTYTASVIFTDGKNAVSNPASCTQVITVTQASANGGSTGGGVGAPIDTQPTSMPVMESPGPEGAFLGIGIIGILVTIIGGFVLFTL